MPITHAFVSAKADGGDATLVRPSNWNASHSVDTISIGTNPAASGTVRLPNASAINARSAANTFDENLILLNSSNQVQVGGGSTVVTFPTSAIVFQAASMKLIGGATQISLRNNADSADNLLITDAGAVTIRSSLKVLGNPIKIQVASGTAGGYLSINNSSDTAGFSVGQAITAAAHQFEIYDGTVGATRLLIDTNGNIDIKVGSVALGGGAAPTVGTIGGSGPATAAQNSWLKIFINGTASYLPVWR